jgi:hypothetical protein
MMKLPVIPAAIRLGLFVLLLLTWSLGCQREPAPSGTQEQENGPQVELPADETTPETTEPTDEADLDLNRPVVDPDSTPEESQTEETVPDGN